MALKDQQKKHARSPRSRRSAKLDKAQPFDPEIIVPLVNGAGSAVILAAGDYAFRQGDPADSVFYIETGKVQITVVSDQGKEGVIALFGPGDFFGEGCLTAQPLRLASAIAMTALRVVGIEKSAMVRLLHEKPSFSEKFMAFLVTLMEVEADIVDHLFNSSEKRLARLLLLLANFNNEGDLSPIVPKISQEVLAARVGTTRSRVNNFMNKFRKLGLIEYNGSIKVHSSLLNVIVHD